MTRWAIRRDLEEINALVGSNQESLISQRNTIAIVCEVDEKIVGYMAYQIKENTAIIWELCVNQNERRKGYGTRMVKRIQKHVTKVRVDEYNLAAQLFFKKNGFVGKQRKNSIVFTRTSNER